MINTILTMVNAFDKSTYLFYEAPVGSGKTLAALVSSLAYLSLVHSDRVEGNRVRFIYLARSYPLLHKVYNLTSELLYHLNFNAKIILLEGKERICPLAFRYGKYIYSICTLLRESRKCEYYTNFINNYGTALKIFHEVIYEKNGKVTIEDWNKLILELVGRRICPYYVIKKFAEKLSDFTLTPYFHLYHPLGFIRLTTHSLNKYRYILIIDEAHNIPFEFFNLTVSTIRKSTVRYILHKLTEYKRSIHNSSENLEILTNYLKLFYQKLFFEHNSDYRRILIKDIFSYSELYDINQYISSNLTSNINILNNIEYIEELINFIRALLNNYQYAMIHNIGNTLYLIPVNEINSLPNIHRGFKSILFISATISPLQHFIKKMLDEYSYNSRCKIIKDVQREYLKSLNIRLIILKDYTSKFIERSITYIERIARDILKIVSKYGPTIVFTASIELARFLSNEVKRLIATFIESGNLINISTPNIELTDFSKEFLRPSLSQLNYLKQASNILCDIFSESNIKSIPKIYNYEVIYISSQRSKYSEGIEIPQNISNLIIFGLPLLPFSPMNDLLAQYLFKYYDRKKRYIYAYLSPAVIYMIQSIGRIVRYGRKRINIFILERRFLSRYVKMLLPEWFNYILNHAIVLSNVDEAIKYLT